MQKEFCRSPFSISLKSRRTRTHCCPYVVWYSPYEKGEKTSIQRSTNLVWKKIKSRHFKISFPSRLTTSFTKLTCKQVLNFQTLLRQMGGRWVLLLVWVSLTKPAEPHVLAKAAQGALRSLGHTATPGSI